MVEALKDVFLEAFGVRHELSESFCLLRTKKLLVRAEEVHNTTIVGDYSIHTA